MVCELVREHLGRLERLSIARSSHSWYRDVVSVVSSFRRAFDMHCEVLFVKEGVSC